MTNTTTTTIYSIERTEGRRAMNGYVETTSLVVQARVRDRELEAASERLATIARGTRDGGNVRQQFGRLLILVGRHIAGESIQTDSPAARPPRALAV